MTVPATATDTRALRYLAWLEASSLPRVSCCVEDVSPDGAKIRGLGAPIPDEFTLHFGRTGEAKVHCRVRSRSATRCDVDFVAYPGPQ
jgi:hypothetical protein